MTAPITAIYVGKQGLTGPAGLYPQATWDPGHGPYVRDTVLAHVGCLWLALRDTAAEPSAAAPDDWAAWLDLGAVAMLDETGKVPAAQLPAIAITDTFEAASQAAMLALTAQRGDICIRSDESRSYVLAADDAGVLANWKVLATPTDTVLSVVGLTGAVSASALKSALALVQADITGLKVTDTPSFAGLTLGGLTLTGQVTISANGAVSAPAVNVTGTPFSGGSGTTTKPLVLFEPTGTASGGWSTAGTMLGVNAPNGFAGNLFDLQVNGTSKVVAAANGTLTAGTFIAGSMRVEGGAMRSSDATFYLQSNSIELGNGGVFGFSSTANASLPKDVSLSRNAAGVMQLGDGGRNALGSLVLAGLTASGAVSFTGLPAADPHVAGRLWTNAGVLSVSAG